MCLKDSYRNIFHNGTALQCLPYPLRLISSLGNLSQFCCSNGQSRQEGSKQQLHFQLLPGAYLQPGVFYGISHIRLYTSLHPLSYVSFSPSKRPEYLVACVSSLQQIYMPTKQLNLRHSTASNTSTKMVDNRPTVDCYPL